MEERIRLKVNGEFRELTVDPQKSLLKVLRYDLRLTGTKCGCDGGRCGTCSVLVGTKLVLSCQIPVGKVGGRKITTIEGLGSPDHLHPIQEAFIQAGAIQCGFCTPGMILATKALLDKNPQPSEEEIIRGLARNLCRCTGYVKIIEAVKLASEFLFGLQRGFVSSQRGAVGQSIPLLDAHKKATGLAQYGDDLFFPGMLHGKVVRSTQVHARIRSIEIAEASACPGVQAILTSQDIPGSNAYGSFVKDQPVLCAARVRFAGDPIALVIAETEEQAEQAVTQVRVHYEPLPVSLDPLESLQETTSPLHPGGNLCAEKKLLSGDIAQGFQESDKVVQRIYQTHFVEHAYLEPEAGIGYLDGEGRITVIAGTQNPYVVHQEVSQILSLQPDQVRIIQPTTGGGFGGKQDLAIHALLALAAFKVRRPVKIRYSRRESMTTTSKRHPYLMDLKVGARKDGTLLSIQAHYLANTGSYTGNAPPVFARSLFHIPGPYYFPHVDLSLKGVFTNNPSAGAMRGFGVPQVTLALECHLDELAQELGIDPWDLRYRNALTAEDILPTGQRIPGKVEMRRCLEAIKPYYEELKRKNINKNPPQGIRHGVGLAAGIYGIGFTGLRFPGRARVLLAEDGTLVIRTAVADLGQGVLTTLAQIAADRLGFPVQKTQVFCSDTLTDPDTGPTSASRQIYFTGNAVLRGLEKLRNIILQLAPQIFEQPVTQVCFSADLIAIEGKPLSAMPRSEFVRMAKEKGQKLEVEEIYEPEDIVIDPKTGKGRPYPAYTFAAQVAEVDVQEETGKVQVKRVVAVQDVGRAINPQIVEGQIHGCILMGIGWALKEVFVPGKTDSFAQYPLPRSIDVPKIKIILVETNEPGAPFGAKGVGECPILPTAPAILNAVAQATGVRSYEIPLRIRRSP
jgi:CO/xanthine dehydrogenase Mo-binding subunit/aerobic-type carbon monoxide dehydrogenase small subunit (CoxS/CutS family)